MAKDQKEKEIGMTVKKAEDMAEWYSQVCLKSELADFAPVKGGYVIRPLGMHAWEQIQQYLNKEIKRKGVQNTYFPMFIPESFFHKEAKHAEGFSPEVAWIEPKDEGEERIAIRPTSETIMCDSFSKWVRSWRDLPLRINQWCNIVRWETEATKLFLRSREFLWQEGHCVYETEADADVETMMMLDVYKEMLSNLLAVPVIYGKKSESEKFAGAKYTTTVEAFMPDGKAIQAGTSHQLGQGFMEAFDVTFQDKDGNKQTPWHTSWGVSTRLIGTAVMLHSDDKGLVLPPKLAMNKIVIVPIIFDKSRDEVLKKCDEVRSLLEEFDPIFDEREEYTPGFKYNYWELRGIPIRIEIGPRDLEANQVVLVRRDNREKQFIEVKDLKAAVAEELQVMHDAMYKKADEQLKDSIIETTDWKEFLKAVKARKLIKTVHCGEAECEDGIKDKSGGATTRCIPVGDEKPFSKKCIHCDKPAKYTIYFSKSY